LVCDALNGGASDVLGNVTVAAVYSYVDQTLGAWEQRPLLKAHVSRLIPIRRCNPLVDRGILRLLPTYFHDPDFEFNLDPSFEPTEDTKNKENQKIFSNFQELRDAGLLVAVDADHLYYAAMNSKSCKLTRLGQFYWNLAKGGKL